MKVHKIVFAADEIDPGLSEEVNPVQTQTPKTKNTPVKGDLTEKIAADRLVRKEQVKTLLAESDRPLSSSDIILALSKTCPDMWSTYIGFSRYMSGQVLSAISDLKKDGIEIEVVDNRRGGLRGRRGGMGRPQHYNTYKLIKKEQ